MRLLNGVYFDSQALWLNTVVNYCYTEILKPLFFWTAYRTMNNIFLQCCSRLYHSCNVGPNFSMWAAAITCLLIKSIFVYFVLQSWRPCTDSMPTLTYGAICTWMTNRNSYSGEVNRWKLILVEFLQLKNSNFQEGVGGCRQVTPVSFSKLSCLNGLFS